MRSLRVVGAGVGVFCAGLAVAVIPASAEPRTFVVTLVGGATITVTVDVPPGTPVDQVTIPNISTPIAEISEVTPQATPTPQASPADPAEPAANSPAAGDEPREREASQPQKATRKRASRARGDQAELEAIAQAERRVKAGKGRNDDGSPTLDDPTFALAIPGAAPIGVPNFFIEKFRIPPFLLPIYQAAGIEYGIRWEVLAAINEIETDYGRNLNVSSAGALGWMQFMPATWKAYGVDANRDGTKDPYNPVDAIFAAARYLKAAGAETDLAKAVFAYNHADWYVDSVLVRARVIGGLPSNFVGSLTGLTQGRFPVHARATYSDQNSRAIRVFSRRGAPVIAVNDGRILRAGRSRRLGDFVQLQDVYGNVYTYGQLGKVVERYAAPRARAAATAEVAAAPKGDVAPAAPASVLTERAFLRPVRPVTQKPALAAEPAVTEFRSTFSAVFGVRNGRLARDVTLKPLKAGSRIVAGTILGRLGQAPLLFEIRPAGRGAPRIDPKPILDGWKLLESTAIYRAAGKNALFGKDAAAPSIGQILLMSKEALIQRVLANPRIEIYGCGRRDVRLGIVDRRALATLEFLAASGFRPTVTSLRCGHSYYTKGGSVSHHSSGNAIDIAKINGVPVLGHQGRGSITELAVQRLLTLQGLMKPDQIITLMTFKAADNTFAMVDHADHIHVGWRPLYGTNSKAAKQVNAILKPKQWIKLVDRLKEIDNPTIPEAE